MRLFALPLVFSACAAFAQTTDDDWLASKQAAEFRERVVQLALIYGESSGIDLQGFKIVTRQAGKPEGSCADIEVVTFKGEKVVRHETVRACRAH
jgi:hypothetical protein